LSLFQHPEVRFVGVNVNAADACKLGATAVVGDAREALNGLRGELAGRVPSPTYRQEVNERVAAWRNDLAADIAPRDDGLLGQGEVLRVVNESVQAGDWVVAAAGWQPGDLLKLWEVAPGSFTHIEFAFSCMGHEIPAGLGIRLHEGEGAEVLVVVGDGTFIMSPTELLTATQEGLKITTVVLDNGGYQSINGLALGNTGSGAGNEFRRRGTDGRLPDGEPIRADIAAMARSMGCDGVAAESIDRLRVLLGAARAGDRSTVIVVPTAPDRPLLSGGAFWDLGVPEVSTDPETQRLTADFIQRRRVQRTYT
jgi:3D-(3,5/4)-trihydroxycyclohexane-1,2-dione acylhydrolase (decyclizing)